MQLGFVSAVVGDLTLEEVFALAADEGFGCVELMCWPPGKADRKYAGISHLDVSDFTVEAASHVRDLLRIHNIGVSGLGYYPNPLDPNPEHRGLVVDHLMKVIRAAAMLDIPVVNTFIGRDPAQTVEANLMVLPHVWNPIVELAKTVGVKIGIEHCPMLFSNDEWPGGKNVASSPAVWRHLFQLYPDGTVGLNFDPSHLIAEMIDAPRALREFGKHMVHVHAKDERIDRERLYEVGVHGLGWHKPKLPGLGDVEWGQFFAALTDTGYDGPVCIEVEDKAYEGSLENRKRALRQSKKFLEQFMG